MEEEIRKRFHEQANHLHQLDARLLSAEGTLREMARDMEKTASVQQFDSLMQIIELKLELLRNELAPLKRAVYGLLTLMIVAVIAAIMRGVLK